MSKLKTPSELEKAAKHAMRPYQTATQQLESHARHERDHYADRAAKALAKADREARSLSGAELGEVRGALEEHDKWESRYQTFKAQAAEQHSKVSVRYEPLTYRRASEGGEYSWIKDQWHARDGSEVESVKRLERHRAEMNVELPKLRRQLESEQRSREEAVGVKYETRVNPDTTVGYGGYFTPPAWVISDFATAPRADRVLSRQFTTFSLPRAPEISSVNLPRITTGASTGAVEDVTTTPDTDIIDTSSTSNLCQIVGEQDIAIQLLEQSPRNAHFDAICLRELQASYDQTLEGQIWTGGGGAYELNGVLNAGIGALTTSEAIGVTSFKALGETAGYVSNHRKLSPTAWFTRGGRAMSLFVAEDEQSRPLYPPIDVQTSRTANPIGVLLGLPIYLTESVPVNLGTEKNKDCILAGRPEDSYFWESVPTLSLWDELLSGTLSARIQVRAYSALIHRYPTAFCSLTGWRVETNL